MRTFVLPDYTDCIVNLACSIRKYFELDYNHNTIKEIDDLLQKKDPRNVVVLLYDGMGYNLLKRKIPGSFLDKNLIRAFSSVAPATTTASTTSMLTGMTPKEHGWLGWDLYVPPEDKIVTLFTNCPKDCKVKISEESIAHKYFSYKNIIQEINEKGKYKSVSISPFGGINYSSLDEMLDILIDECNKEGKKYIYCYNQEPDTTLHAQGTENETVDALFKTISEKTEAMFNKLGDDTLVIVVADHGHLNCTGVLLDDYPDFKNTLAGDIWVEGRLCAFRVKDEENFKKLFAKYFTDDFTLYTQKEIIDMELFGPGKEHELFRKSLGDYFALAKTNKFFRYCDRSINLKSMHAGFTEDEMLIPLIVLSK